MAAEQGYNSTACWQMNLLGAKLLLKL